MCNQSTKLRGVSETRCPWGKRSKKSVLSGRKNPQNPRTWFTTFTSQCRPRPGPSPDPLFFVFLTFSLPMKRGRCERPFVLREKDTRRSFSTKDGLKKTVVNDCQSYIIGQESSLGPQFPLFLGTLGRGDIQQLVQK